MRFGKSVKAPLASKLSLRVWNSGISSSFVALGIALVIALFYNATFWLDVVERFTDISFDSLGFLLTFYLLLTLFIFLLLNVFLHSWLFKPFAGLLIVASAFITYFNHMGVVIDDSMMKNIMETNTREALELMSVPLLIYVVGLGVLPIIFLVKLKVNYRGFWATFKNSSMVSIVLACLLAGLLFSNFQFTTFFGRENRDLRLFTNPVYPIISLRRFIADHFKSPPIFKAIGLDAKQVKPAATPRRVGIFMVGETARADHLGINGYSKPTTPFLAKKLEQGQLLNFSHATSCGTFTAYSVPCMFSMLAADDFSTTKAGEQSNVLDILEHAGVKTLWRDNNSSCKGVCDRIESESFREGVDESSVYFHDGEYLDEILLTRLTEIIASTDKDILIVMHQLGSHGPAYHRRYPDAFAQFQPSCASNSPQDCTPEEVSNSYDNTILYTDYVLNKTIEFLEGNSDKYQSFMMYVSDHGESLGENGVYLHGLPKSIAPKAQTHVPLVVWMSDTFARTQNIVVGSHAAGMYKDCVERPVSHDNLAHTLLSFFDVATQLKNPDLNLFGAACQP